MILFTVLLLMVTLIACQAVDERSAAPLTDEQKLNLELATQANVSSFGAPPLIPEDHPVVIGEDYNETEIGGELCLDCHDSADEEDTPQTLHPERRSCLQCHIVTAEESATADDFKVDNDFIKQIP